MLHLYALVSSPAQLPDTVGIDDAPLRALAVDSEIDAIVSEGAARRTGAPTETEVLGHARAVDAIAAANAATLPARFAVEPSEPDDLRRPLLQRGGQSGPAPLAQAAVAIRAGARARRGMRRAGPPRGAVRAQRRSLDSGLGARVHA